MARRANTIFAVAVTALLLMVTAPLSPASGQTTAPTFEVELLARPLGFQSVPFDINDDGVAVGYYLDSSLNYRSIRWAADGTPADLAPAGSWSQAHGIASDGTIGGYYGTQLRTTTPALWDGTWDPVPQRRNYTGGVVKAVNSGGWAVGRSLHSRTRTHRPVLWRNGRMRILASSGSVSDINDKRVSVGWTDVNGFSQATAWNRTSLTLLQGERGSTARSISANGMIVGATPDPVTNASRPSVWANLDAAPMPLDDLEGIRGAAVDINSAGWVVGTSSFDSYNLSGDAILWLADGTAHNLNDLVPAGSDWNLISAVAVNDSGQILGFGTCSCAQGQSAFVLTPVE